MGIVIRMIKLVAAKASSGCVCVLPAASVYVALFPGIQLTVLSDPEPSEVWIFPPPISTLVPAGCPFAVVIVATPPPPAVAAALFSTIDAVCPLLSRLLIS
ncbi:MAG: hypothetical protein IPL03_13580 [Sterolibacteriaceae bacterium]|nr:hypothetical protein [Candidatus Methylophosphatis haderslevensis]